MFLRLSVHRIPFSSLCLSCPLLDQNLTTNNQKTGGIAFTPVAPDSLEFQLGAAWHFPPFAVALGASYFQRLLAALPALAAAARRCPALAALAPPLAAAGALMPPHAAQPPPAPAEAAAVGATLRSAQFACIFLATKVADQVHAFGLLRFVLSTLSGRGCSISLEQAAEVELRCLKGLGWRLGPFFEGDVFGGD